MFSSLPRRQQSDLQSEYLRKVADARRPRLTDVEVALEAAERKHQAERDEWAKRKPPPPDEGAKRKPRILVQDKIALLQDELAQQINCATGSLSASEARIQDVGESIEIEGILRAAHEHVRDGRRFVAKAIEIANEALLVGREVYDDDWVKKMEELLERLRKNNCD
ncbi:hypothetical protein R1sor_008169 [Riccia sorocarpa]|uniref:Uncharacterized protein n=1 Tax=Riccia sorocarpa TaxID=122646 RepID=A0ABD3HSN3_9MARC